jgi:glutathione S-transferase
VGDSYSVADIALFAYTHLGPEAGHDLAKFPAVSAWLARVRAQPGYFEME